MMRSDNREQGSVLIQAKEFVPARAKAFVLVKAKVLSCLGDCSRSRVGNFEDKLRAGCVTCTTSQKLKLGIVQKSEGAVPNVEETDGLQTERIDKMLPIPLESVYFEGKLREAVMVSYKGEVQLFLGNAGTTMRSLVAVVTVAGGNARYVLDGIPRVR
ncbi:hypothetical protein Droror1_Dr00000798 [Drosera rotundifolia]